MPHPPHRTTENGERTTRLTRAETRKGLRGVALEGLAGRSMEAMTTGVFLIGMAMQLGASNLVIGLLGAIPFLANLAQLPAVHLIEKHRDRRKFVTIFCAGARSFLLVVALTPFLPPPYALVAMVAAMSVRYTLGSMSSCAWNSWMRDLVPERVLGRFFGTRLFYTTGLATAVAFGAGWFIDWWGRAHPGQGVYAYSILYALGFLAGMISTAIITTIPHPPMADPEAKEYERGLTLAKLKQPFRHKNFRKLMRFLIAWNFAANLATPFFVVYMHRMLGYDMTFVISITLISQFVNVFAFRLWGQYSDRYSNKTVLAICGSLFVFSLLGWTFTTFPDKHAYTLPLLVALHVFMGIATAGIKLSSSNIAMKLAPASNATSFLAVNTLLTSLAAGVAPLVGGLFADHFVGKVLTMEFHWMTQGQEAVIHTLILQHWDFLFILAFFIGIYSLGWLALVHEEGSVESKTVIRELMLDSARLLKSISTIDGLRDLTTLPMAMMVNLAGHMKKRGSRGQGSGGREGRLPVTDTDRPSPLAGEGGRAGGADG